MGSVEPYATAAGRRYRVRYRTPDRKSREKAGFKVKRDAELYLASVEVKKATGEFIDVSAGKVTVRTLGAVWLASQTHLKPSALRVIETAWRVHVEPAWGDKAISELRHTEIQSWLSRMTTGGPRKPLSGAVVIRNYGVLAAILDNAVKDRLLPSNPARGVTLPRKAKKVRRYLTHEEVWKVATAAGEYSTLVLLLAYTGLRWGEVTALRVKHLDALRRRLTVAENAVALGSVIHVGTPKSHEARVVPYPQFLSEPIARLAEGKTRDMLILGDGVNHLKRPKTSSGQTSWFIRALAEAGVEPLTVHDLRHTAASLAISAGANVKALQRMLGHASAAMTLDTYADLFSDDLDAVSDALDTAVQRAVVGDRWGRAAR